MMKPVICFIKQSTMSVLRTANIPNFHGIQIRGKMKLLVQSFSKK